MEPISPERYRQILDGIELRGISLRSVRAELREPQIPQRAVIGIRDQAEFSNAEGGFSIFVRYILTAKVRNKIFLKIEAAYELFFSSEEEISDEFFDIYREISLPFNIWPFFRELVNSLTARMGIPPITLPLFKK